MLFNFISKVIKNITYLLLSGFLFFCFSAFAFDNSHSNLSNQEWANQKQQELSSIKRNKDYINAKNFAESLKQRAKYNNTDAVDWAKEQVLKKRKIEQSKEDLKNALSATKTGVNIDSLISQYANKMPSSSNLLHKKTSDLLIFVSFSMPKQSLRLWLEQAKIAGGVLVIRGLVNNSFKETANVIREILGKTKGGFEVNPIAFKKYKIKVVPAVVVQSDLPTDMAACFVGENEQHNCDGNLDAYDVVYGNVSLQRALEGISKKGSVASNKADLILQRMRNLS